MTNPRSLPIGMLLNRHTSLIDAYLRIPQPLAKLLYRSVRATIAKDPRQSQFDAVFKHVICESIPGDYLEFGVFRGSSMALAYKCATRGHLEKMRFFGFDSFEGLPDSEGGVFEKGTMVCSQKQFLKLIAQYGIDTTRVTTVKGWYKESLTAQLRQTHALTQAAVVNIDCDLYESTKIVLDFIADLLKPGSILIFDDWYHFAHKVNPAQYGEQRAFEEWHISKYFRVFKDVVGRSKSFIRI